MIFKNIFLAWIMAVLLAACGDKGQQADQNNVSKVDGDRVMFYVKHDAERKAKLADCHARAVNSFANTDDATECRAAGKAADQALLTPSSTSTPKKYKQF